MEPNRRFSLLTFPQFFDGATLSVNIVVLPRNQNPLMPPIQSPGGSENPPPFADAHLGFTANIITGLLEFPNNHPTISGIALNTTTPANMRNLFEALGFHLIRGFAQNASANPVPTDKAEPARPEALTVKKYLPKSYRQAFNFTTPRTRNAMTDDSYHCAVKSARAVRGFRRDSDDISWGKVFAYAFRQPLLARQLGMIYETSLTIQAEHFPEGGWLYIDLGPESDFRDQQDSDPTFIKRYAARIPPLIPGEPRQVFAALQFPVNNKAQAIDPTPIDGNYDQLFIEAAYYDDGFAKIVHCMQPQDRNLLIEENEGTHPVKDVGIRLGWDDEQILIWYMRQLMVDSSVTDPDQRLDAPLGVFGFSVDVREAASPQNPWESLNFVESRTTLTLPKKPKQPGEILTLGDFRGELPYQVYPMQLDGRKDVNYWLPMYFANWNGQSMVLPDPDAAGVYQTTNERVDKDPEIQPDLLRQGTGTGVSGPAQNRLNQVYRPGEIRAVLRYGRNYEFRVRLRDLSGGSAPPSAGPINESASDIVACRFKRYLSPQQPRIADLPVNTDEVTAISHLTVRRPKLGYPAIVYTGKYHNPIDRLMAQANAGLVDDEEREGLGIADPDVDRLEITVEVQALKMDKLLSVSGREDYSHLYTTYRSFPRITSDEDYNASLSIPIVYRDVRVLHTGAEIDIRTDLQLTDDIDQLNEIVLPTARTIRLTLRAVCEEKEDNALYYGCISPGNPAADNRFGEPVQLRMHHPSENETGLFVNSPLSQRLQGIYLQPWVPPAFDGRFTTLLLGKESAETPDPIQLLATQLDVKNIGLTLNAPKGKRVVFGCSSRIGHTLAPDHSSITFSSRSDLTNHWLCCISLDLDRDWAWDAVKTRSFLISRTMRFSADLEEEAQFAEIGEVEIRRTASFEALQTPERNSTRLLFIDAVEPKKLQPPDQGDPDFPDTIEVQYQITTQFKADHATQQDEAVELAIVLPITTRPAQVPKIVSAGIALSPYMRSEDYSTTEPRRRYLWIEFDEPVLDPNDIYFARMLANASDPLISHNHPELFVAPEEPALPLDPEYMRVIIPGSTNDLAGLNAMQPMEKSTTSDRHYLLPLPPGLHSDSDEMFGFFTYEFRVGHYRNAATQEMAWTTAQGRFGRRLRATGIQHPAPTLSCLVSRDQEKVWVSAPYATAVFDGKNVTADPPRTQLWCLLYAQVKQADDKTYRNILLDDRKLDWRVAVEKRKNINPLEEYTIAELDTLKSIAIKHFHDDISYAKLLPGLRLVVSQTKNKDGTRYGTAVWGNDEVNQLLHLFGLPEKAPLSVLVVETLPTITKIFDHISGLEKPEVYRKIRDLVPEEQKAVFENIIENSENLKKEQLFSFTPSPVDEELGHHRFLRESPLYKVPAICRLEG